MRVEVSSELKNFYSLLFRYFLSSGSFPLSSFLHHLAPTVAFLCEFGCRRLVSLPLVILGHYRCHSIFALDPTFLVAWGYDPTGI